MTIKSCFKRKVVLNDKIKSKLQSISSLNYIKCKGGTTLINTKIKSATRKSKKT